MNNQAQNQSSFTLVEVMVTMAIFSLIIATVLSSLVQISKFNYMSAQKVVAFGLAYDALENLKSENYADVTSGHALLTPEEVKLTHLGGKNRVALNAWRWGEVEEKFSPQRKVITIWIGWTYQDKHHFEKVDGTIFPE